MAIIARHSLSELESKVEPLWWQKAGLNYTASGYGSKIPTRYMVRLPGSKRWRRVYCAIFSNSGPCYVPHGEDWIVIHD
jgi:hypothetical protein